MFNRWPRCWQKQYRSSEKHSKTRVLGSDQTQWKTFSPSRIQRLTQKHSKTRVLGSDQQKHWKHFYHLGSLVVRESRVWRARTSDKTTEKRYFEACIFSEETTLKHHFKIGNLHFFRRLKTNFWGGGITWKLAISQCVHPGAYTSMTQPHFGAKDVCCIEQKVAKWKAFLKVASF